MAGWTVENKLTLTDILLKGVTALAVVVAGFVGVVKYFDDQQLHRESREKELAELRLKSDADEAQRQQERQQLAAKQQAEANQRVREFQIKFFEHQMLAYSLICDAAARIATAERLADADDAIRTFNQLYFGKVCIFESKEVSSAQVKLYRALVQMDDHSQPPPQELRVLCLGLAAACSSHLRESFMLPQSHASSDRFDHVPLAAPAPKPATHD
jgi:hypothetical protein